MSTTPVYIRSQEQGYAHPKCFLSQMNTCSRELTGEHYISHSVLKTIEAESRSIRVVGLKWLPKDKLSSIGKSRLVANMLCKAHNSALSPLDQSAVSLITAIGAIDRELQAAVPRANKFLVDGASLERWVLKMVIGLVHSGQITQKESGEPFRLNGKCVQLLCEPFARWPHGWGLYAALPLGSVHHSSSFELVPVHAQRTGELLALALKFNGIQMNFMMGKAGPDIRPGILRPNRVVFAKGRVSSEICFSWAGKKPGAEVRYEHAGVYSGPSPDHPFA